MNDPDLKQIWMRFNGNIGALWAFAEKISAVADEEDQKQLSVIASKVAALFGDDPLEVENELKHSVYIAEETGVEPILSEIADAKEVIEALSSDEFKSQVNEWVKDNPNKENRLIEFLRMIFEPQATHGVILRRSAFVLIASFFETYLVDLLSAYFTINPNSSLSQKDVKEGNFPSRIKLLKQTGVSFSQFVDLEKSLDEIIRRRNKFVHNDGIIDQSYLNVATVLNPNMIPGRRLRISQTYLIESIETVYVLAYLIFQKCWRTWGKEKNPKADEHYGNILYTLLKQNRNRAASDLAGRRNNFIIRRKERQLITVNQAIALREMGEVVEAKKLLRAEIRMPASPAIELALHILRENYDSAYILMTHLLNQNPRERLWSEWPLFRPVASDPRFIPLLERIS